MSRTVSVLLIAAAVPMIGWNVHAQTKESPLLLYKDDCPAPKKTKTVSPKYPSTARKHGASEVPPRPNCVSQFGDRASPPRKVADYKPDISDLAGIKTHAGVLIFEITVLPSGRVTDVRLVKEVDPHAPWPALVERWRSAIAQWRYEPAIVDKKPIAACLTVTVNIHVT